MGLNGFKSFVVKFTSDLGRPQKLFSITKSKSAPSGAVDKVSGCHVQVPGSAPTKVVFSDTTQCGFMQRECLESE